MRMPLHIILKKEGRPMIFDAHVHLPCYDDRLTTLDQKRERLLSDLAANGVDGAMVIADSESVSNIGTPAECVALFEGDKNIFVMGGISPLIDYQMRLAQLDDLLNRKKIVAIKLYPGHEAFYMDDPRLGDVYALCEKHDVPLAVHTGWDNPHYTQPRFFPEIAQQHPSLQLVICHLCWPDVDLCYERTAPHPNIHWDISSLAHETDALQKTAYSLSAMAKHHPERILFGSDYGMCSIKAHLDLVHSLPIPEAQKRMILAGNALKLYNISLP